MLTSAARPAPAVNFSALRAREFSRLDERGEAYLDYAGAALYASSQIRQYHALLAGGVFGNPHSEHDASRASTTTIDAARARVLRAFNVTSDTHVVCFTANCSAAIKLVAESFPFGAHRGLVLSADNHNSVNGIREYAIRAGGPVVTMPIDGDLRLVDPEGVIARAQQAGHGLLAFPAQSNFSGVRHPLSIVDAARANGLRVLLDAAAFVPTAALDLDACPADFTVVSFYKIFGFPTGVGALIARRDTLGTLRRPWFAGGTVEFVSVQHARHQLRAAHEAFEDGTANFLGIAALEAGHAFVGRISLQEIGQHASALSVRLVEALTALRHRNGAPVVRIYGPNDRRECGATVAFNVLDTVGMPIPFSAVESRARDARVCVRGGCFCNPGAAEAAFRWDAHDTLRCLDALGDQFTVQGFADGLGPASEVGAVRASLGLASNEADVDQLVHVIRAFQR